MSVVDDRQINSLIDKLSASRAKNESLKELLDSQVKANCGMAVKLNKVEESRDELLKALLFANEVLEDDERFLDFEDIITEARDLKEKTNE